MAVDEADAVCAGGLVIEAETVTDWRKLFEDVFRDSSRRKLFNLVGLTILKPSHSIITFLDNPL